MSSISSILECTPWRCSSNVSSGALCLRRIDSSPSKVLVLEIGHLRISTGCNSGNANSDAFFSMIVCIASSSDGPSGSIRGSRRSAYIFVHKPFSVKWALRSTIPVDSEIESRKRSLDKPDEWMNRIREGPPSDFGLESIDCRIACSNIHFGKGPLGICSKVISMTPPTFLLFFDGR